MKCWEVSGIFTNVCGDRATGVTGFYTGANDEMTLKWVFMGLMMFGCQGHDHTPTLAVKTCPTCGHEVEVFSTDTIIDCEVCGTPIYNDAVSCVQWCRYAKSCVGEAEYDRLMEVAKLQQERAAAAAEPSA